MPKKYNIKTKTTPPRFNPVGKYAPIEFRENCAGSCRECVKKKCIYDVFKESYQHISAMSEPEFLYKCQSCFRCVQECTKGLFSRAIDPGYRTLGNDYWTPEIIHGIWDQSQTGKVPVSGAGYRGPFVGKGFDSMWTDMSEIVRPTRDGIHGREYINTCIELSRRNKYLKFNDDMTIASNTVPIFEIPIPVMLQQPKCGLVNKNVLSAMVKAAHSLETMMFIDPECYDDDFASSAEYLIPLLTKDNYVDFEDILKQSRAVELFYDSEIRREIEKLRSDQPDLMISIGIPLNAKAVQRAVELSECEVDVLHFYADGDGNEVDTEEPSFLKEMIRQIHLALVDKCVRQKVNLVFSGGIAMAEHVAKAIVCGADGVVIDIAALVSLECKLCRQCDNGKPCPVGIGEIDPEWGRQRILNLIGAWRNQLIEVMGAMGIRETRRLRGEIGRSMWFEDLEKESFEPLFGERKVSGLG